MEEQEQRQKKMKAGEAKKGKMMNVTTYHHEHVRGVSGFLFSQLDSS